jgi:acyl-CoA dehydrogenase
MRCAFVSLSSSAHVAVQNEELVAEKVFGIFAKANMLIPSLACPLPVEQLKKLGIHEFMGVKVEDYDYLYTFIYWDEMVRSDMVGPAVVLRAIRCAAGLLACPVL